MPDEDSYNVIFIFLDGIGLGSAAASNPLYNGAMPQLIRFLGQPFLKGLSVNEKEKLAKGIDATMGVEGIPQSATGQTALFTGINASKKLGVHLPAFPNEPLKEIIAKHSVFKTAREYGITSTFANGYRPSYFEMVEREEAFVSVTTLSMMAAGHQARFITDKACENAVLWDITREITKQSIKTELDIVTPELAGTHLLKIAKEHNLTIFESFLPDLFGHKMKSENAIYYLNIIDDFLHHIIKNKPRNTTLLVTSDHGNVEDLGTSFHTRNEVPLIVIGPGASHFSNILSIVEISPKIIEWFLV